MKRNFKKVLSILVFIAFLFIVSSCESVKKEEFKFEEWNECESLTNLVNYVEDVTDKNSKDYIPVEDRIAVFDMDGTLCGELFPTYIEYLLLEYRVFEDDSYTADDETLATAQLIRDNNGFPSDMAMRHAIGQAKAFSGMSVNDFINYVKEFLKIKAAGFENLTYATSFYVPMLEVMKYLQLNEFTTYIVSGSDRFICRAAASEICNVPYRQIIGMDVRLETEGQTIDSLDYQFKPGDTVVRTEDVLIKNLKMNKVNQIVQEIGKQPVLSFGNSSGDVSMHNYTITNNPYKALAFMLIANDDVRDYGNVEKATKLGLEWEEKGYNVISMRDDFKTIYPENVVRLK